MKKIRVKNLILEYESVFAKHPYRSYQRFIKIELTDTTLVQERYKPTPHFKRNELEKHIEQLQKADIIEESDLNYL